MARSIRITPRALVLLSVGGLTGALSAPALAQQDLAACLAIPDMAQRVQCYDAIARSQQAAPPAAPVQAPAATAPLPAPVAAAAVPAPVARPAAPVSTPQQEFGLTTAQREARRPDAQQQLTELALTVSSAKPVGPGYWQFGMTDGSVWRVEEVMRSFRPPKAGEQVSIVRGALGAFYLDADRQPRVRIKRVS